MLEDFCGGVLIMDSQAIQDVIISLRDNNNSSPTLNRKYIRG